MKFLILASLCCFVLVINAAIMPMHEEDIAHAGLERQKRSPFILTALGLAGLAGAKLIGAGLASLAGAGLVGAGLGAKAGFATGALAGSAARSYGGVYHYNYAPAVNYNKNLEYRAELRVGTQP